MLFLTSERKRETKCPAKGSLNPLYAGISSNGAADEAIGSDAVPTKLVAEVENGFRGRFRDKHFETDRNEDQNCR